MKIDVDQIVTVRKHRGKLFRKDYFGSYFWDIILILYSHEINERPVDAREVARRLDLRQSAVLRYLKILFADGFVCAYEHGTDQEFDTARDCLALTRQGFENAGAVIQRMRTIFS